MGEQFLLIATIIFRHNYFEDSLFHSLEARPTAETMQKLKNLGLVRRPFSGGFYLFRSTQNRVPVSEGEEPLRFGLSSEDPYYVNYTEFNNLKSIEENLIYTNIDASYSENSLEYHLENYISRKNLVRGNVQQGTFLAIEIHLGNLLDHFEKSGKTVTYILDFEPRKTFWKYFLIFNSTPFSHLIIKNKTDEDAFELGMENDVLTFTSKKPIALSQRPKESFQLVQKSTTLHKPDKIIVKHLPTPSPEQLHWSEDASIKTGFSQLYVYI